MKKISLLVILTIVQLESFAQTPYTISKDDQHSGGFIFNGVLSKYILINEPSFKWYASNQLAYKPDVSIVNAMEAAKSSVHFVIFGGTWCDDTQFILPKFFKLQETSGFPDNGISFFGVNRDKKTWGNISDAFHVTNVPTIIVFKNGKEVGRVIEYGKTGKWDAELAELIK